MAEDKTEMVLVPVEPTPEMLEAIWSVRISNGGEAMRECYRAMLDARPSADKAEGVGEGKIVWAFRMPLAGFASGSTSLHYTAHREDIPADASGIEPFYAPGTDPAIARLTEVLDQRNADIKRLSDQVGDVSREAQTLRTQTERQIREISGWVVKQEKAQQDIRKLENLLMNSAEFCVSETERADTAETALAQRDADIAKAVEDERDRIIVHVREMMKRFEKGSASQNNFKALADMLERGDPLARGRASSATQADGGATQPAKEAGQ